MLKNIRRFFLRYLRKMRFLPSEMYVKFHYEYFSGEKLNLKDPKKINAKLEWYKVYYRHRILNKLVDKYEVRSYVEEKIGKVYLNECYGVYNDPKKIPFENLPQKFVIKATHSSGHNLIVKDKSNLNIKIELKKLKKWLKINQYYRMGQEWAYKDVTPRVIIEKYLEDNNQKGLTDYKFYCFDGDAKFIDVHTDREINHKQGCFDLEFNLLPFGKSENYARISENDIEKPINLKEMISCAELLSDGLPFVRVDFYSVEGKTIFGEMTFYPSDARKKFYPEKSNLLIGAYFKLPKCKNVK